LESVLNADIPQQIASLSDLAALLKTRGPTMITPNQDSPLGLAQKLIWDAVDHGAQVIHLSPSEAGHEITYRSSGGLEPIIHLPNDGFDALDEAWKLASTQVSDVNRRRIFMTRGEAEGRERVHVKYQKVETLRGPRITLGLIKESVVPIDLARIAPDEADAATLERWSGRSHGLVLLAGRSGSGKTTTAYVCLKKLAAAGDKVIFTIEEEVGEYLHGVNQVEVNLDDERAYRDAFSAIFASDLDVLFISSTFAQRHRSTLWGTALSAAESGHLVFVQMEADSAKDALTKFQAAVDRPVDEHLVGAVWQELIAKETGGRKAAYDFLPGRLDHPTDS